MARARKQTDDDTPGQPIGGDDLAGDDDASEADPLGTTTPVGAEDGDTWHPSDEDEEAADDDGEQEA